ncbi:sphingosine 1-phosphate receptor 1-like [Stylophora pistillata]|uniref:sphingosine 1-phosphate receptor 1-like n=1 Tax=Stylophora pistillata TaxID=50429 RepID=UPI000C055EF5|nr:sphingosine 1-phosphate receptor 1-like [Stylophora pistillata]
MAELLAAFILNLITIIVFKKQRQLQRRSTYLIIHLAIVDLLVGAVSGPLCFTPPVTKVSLEYLRSILCRLFPIASVTNLVAISLERLHATFFPLLHLTAKSRAYVIAIVAIWVISTSVETIQAFTFQRNLQLVSGIIYFSYFSSVVLIISISYLLICIRVRRSPLLQHQSTAIRTRERRLTNSLIIVTFASLLTLSPIFIYAIMQTLFSVPELSLSKLSGLRFFLGVVLSLGLNSSINPVIYSMTNSEFRAGMARMCHRRHGRLNQIHAIPAYVNPGIFSLKECDRHHLP